MRADVPVRVAAMIVGGLALAGGSLAGCSHGGASLGQVDQAFLAEVEDAQPSITAVRNAGQLVGLGHAVCADLGSGASYQEIADRLSLTSGASSLPSEALGAVIQAAADNYCPQYRSRV